MPLTAPRRTLDDPLWAELVHGLQGRMTELASAVRGLQVNSVLRASVDQLNPAGKATFGFAVPFAAVAVTNLGVGLLTVAAAPEADPAPTVGVGLAIVPGGRSACVALTGNTLTLYGDAGAYVSLAVYSHPQSPSFA